MLDRFIVRRLGEYLREAGSEGAVVDVGFGEEGWTTGELFEALRSEAIGSEVVGVEVDAGRVKKAQALAEPGLRFEQGGFDLGAAVGRPIAVIRAMNVLRQYGPHEVEEAHRAWGASLCEGGYLLEGTCDGAGAVGSAHVLVRREGQMHKVGLVLWTDFSKGFGPWMFRDWLPADLRRSLRPKTSVVGGGDVGAGECPGMYEVLERWAQLAKEVRDEVRDEGERGLEAVFFESVRRLGMEVRAVEESPKLWREGYVFVRGVYGWGEDVQAVVC